MVKEQGFCAVVVSEGVQGPDGKFLSDQDRPNAGVFSLQDEEQALCFLSIGTAASRRPRRARPALAHYVSELEVPS